MEEPGGTWRMCSRPSAGFDARRPDRRIKRNACVNIRTHSKLEAVIARARVVCSTWVGRWASRPLLEIVGDSHPTLSALGEFAIWSPPPQARSKYACACRNFVSTIQQFRRNTLSSAGDDRSVGCTAFHIND